MKLLRQDFLKSLSIAKSALATNSQLQELSHFWFDGKFLYAYNETLGIRVPFESDFTGGVKGDLLLGILEKASGAEVKTDTEGGELYLTIGKSQITFTLLPYNDFAEIWQPNEPEWDNSYAISEGFLEGISSTLFSVGDSKVMNPEQKGVTIIQKSNDVANFYTTDAKTISWCRIETSDAIFSSFDHNSRCVIVTDFCEQIKKLAKPGTKLSIDEQTAALLTNDETFVFSRLVEEGGEPADFENLLEQFTSNIEEYIPVPSELGPALDRAELITTKSGNESVPVKMQITTRKAREEVIPTMNLYAKTQYGEIDDDVELDKAHSKISVNIDPSLVKRALDGRKEFAVTKDCVILKGPDNFTHIIAPN